jgi:hypothetical protein
VIFDSGDVYCGEVSENSLNGHGEMVYANGDRYVGEFVKGKPQGKGKLVPKDGEPLEGEFSNGELIQMSNTEKADSLKVQSDIQGLITKNSIQDKKCFVSENDRITLRSFPKQMFSVSQSSKSNSDPLKSKNLNVLNLNNKNKNERKKSLCIYSLKDELKGLRSKTQKIENKDLPNIFTFLRKVTGKGNNESKGDSKNTKKSIPDDSKSEQIMYSQTTIDSFRPSQINFNSNFSSSSPFTNSEGNANSGNKLKPDYQQNLEQYSLYSTQSNSMGPKISFVKNNFWNTKHFFPKNLN